VGPSRDLQSVQLDIAILVIAEEGQHEKHFPDFDNYSKPFVIDVRSDDQVPPVRLNTARARSGERGMDVLWPHVTLHHPAKGVFMD